MAELAVVRRYARALFEIARNQQAVDRVEQDLAVVDQSLRDVPLLGRALRAPTVTSAEKQGLLQRAFGGSLSDLTIRFLNLVIDRRREDVLTDIHDEFHSLANAARDILAVQVTSAVELTSDQQRELIEALGKRTGKTVQLELSVDPAILGGLVVRLGDTVIDGSVRNKLAQLRLRLLGGHGNQ